MPSLPRPARGNRPGWCPERPAPLGAGATPAPDTTSEGRCSTTSPGLPRWFTDAACLGMPSEVFFPAKGQQATPALEVCDGCPVTEPCLDYAIRERLVLGVFGGTTPPAAPPSTTRV
jgi:hypothetical protein